MTVVALVRDLILASRIEEATVAANATFRRIDSIEDLPPPADVSLAFVDWSERQPDWGGRLREWRGQAEVSSGARLVLFGPHTDLDGHAAAKRQGTGPMMSRSKLVADLPMLVRAAVAATP